MISKAENGTSGSHHAAMLTAVWPGPRRLLSRAEAAKYIAIGPTKFDQLVADKRMPAPKLIDSKQVWDVVDLDAAIADLPYKEAASYWGEGAEHDYRH